MRRRQSCVFLLISALLCASARAGDTQRLHQYDVSVDAALTTLNVRACFAGTTPRYLMAESQAAAGAIRNARIEGSTLRLEPNGAQLPLRMDRPDACLRYDVDVADAGDDPQPAGNLGGRIGDNVLLDIGRWFWRPESLSEIEDIRVRFNLPDGIAVSTPWRADAEGGPNAFRVGATPYDWPAMMVLGQFDRATFEAAGAQIQLVILGAGGASRLSLQRVRDWLRPGIQSVAGVHGQFPMSHVRIMVVANAPGSEPVPWAFVHRGGGASVQFHVNQKLPDADILRDWTIYHELSHLLLPYVISQDAWASEGLATYYQNVLRARSGAISALQGWQALHAGFVRGRSSQQGSTLADATQRMYRNAGHQRVYWQGAALWLLADYRVRVRTNGQHSLDTALARITRCCMAQGEQWRARDLLVQLDAATGTTVFTELHDQQIVSPDFPDLREVYDGLGLRVQDSKLVTMDLSPHQVMRADIMCGADNSACRMTAQ